MIVNALFRASKEVEEALQIRCSLVLHPVERPEKVHYICSNNTADKLLPLQEKNSARLISLDIGSVCVHDNEQTCQRQSIRFFNSSLQHRIAATVSHFF